jgi:hypothetical protein
MFFKAIGMFRNAAVKSFSVAEMFFNVVGMFRNIVGKSFNVGGRFFNAAGASVFAPFSFG